MGMQCSFSAQKAHSGFALRWKKRENAVVGRALEVVVESKLWRYLCHSHAWSRAVTAAGWVQLCHISRWPPAHPTKPVLRNLCVSRTWIILAVLDWIFSCSPTSLGLCAEPHGVCVCEWHGSVIHISLSLHQNNVFMFMGFLGCEK